MKRARWLRALARPVLRSHSLVLLLLVLDASSVAAQQYLVIVGGIGGEPKYEAAFSSQTTRLAESARDRFGFPEDHVVLLTESPDRDGAHGRSSKAEIDRVLGDLAERVEPDAQIVLVLIGHGSGVTGAPRFNVPGPDATADDFALWLSRFPSQRVVFVNLSSASGAFIAPLAKPGRVLITATRSAAERNEVLFAEHFVNAFTGNESDIDKDGRVSMLEAFSYARHEVEREYERDNRLLTEHAMLEDDGDGEASREPSATEGDGMLAARIAFGEAPRVEVDAVTDPELAALYVRRQELRQELEALRSRRSAMDDDAYQVALERVLLDLAQTGRAIREMEGGSR